jgi:2-keto-4-pentenoate hydratase/2-oxohepta-3-ene-1,7-dioic acid hydratase in catechol pathway
MVEAYLNGERRQHGNTRNMVFGVAAQVSFISRIMTLKPGDVSEIIETPAGYQFFFLLSGEEKAIVVTAALEAVKEEIRQKIFEEKLKTAYSEWVRKLKEDAYIQIL